MPRGAAKISRRALTGQAAVDFMSSYGFALLIIGISIYAVMQIGIFNYSASPQYCYPDTPFSCIAYSINTSGSLSMRLSQSSGGVLIITGAACSSAPNTVSVGPQYGNIGIANSVVAPAYYPAGNLLPASGVALYPGTSTTLYVKCYSGTAPASSAIGSTFTGYLWLNYTFTGLPSGYHYVSRAASMNVKYTQ